MTKFLIIALLTLIAPALRAQSNLIDNFTAPQTIEVGKVTEINIAVGTTATQIQEIIDNAISQSSDKHTIHIKFKPNATYHLSLPESHKRQILFYIGKVGGKTPQNIVIDGQGAHIMIESYTRFLHAQDGVNIMVKGFSVDYAIRQITHGTVVKIDRSKNLYDVQIDKGRPLLNDPTYLNPTLKWVMVMEDDGKGGHKLVYGLPTTIGYKPGCTDMGNGLFRLKLRGSYDHSTQYTTMSNDPMLSNIKEGHRVALLARKTGYSIVRAMNNKYFTLRDIRLYNSPAAAINDYNSERSCYYNVTVRSDEGSLFTTTADGIFVVTQRNGPWIERCDLWGIGDDAVVLKNNTLKYIGASKDAQRPYEFNFRNFRADFDLIKGDTIALFNMKDRTLVSQHVVKDVKRSSKPNVVNVGFDKPLNLDASNESIWIYNLNTQCNNFVIKDSQFTDNRRWGVLCAGANGTIIGNRFTRSQNSAIFMINSPLYEKAQTGAPPRNIEIVDNVFDECWHSINSHPYAVIASRMRGESDSTRREDMDGNDDKGDWNAIRNISIRNNTISNWSPTTKAIVTQGKNGLKDVNIYGIFLRDVDGAEITGNTFTLKKGKPTQDQAIRLIDAERVVVKNNTLK